MDIHSLIPGTPCQFFFFAVVERMDRSNTNGICVACICVGIM